MAGEKKKRSKALVKASDPARRVRGQARAEAAFPVAPPMAGLPASYGKVLAQLKARVEQVRLSTVLAANSGLIVPIWLLHPGRADDGPLGQDVSA